MLHIFRERKNLKNALPNSMLIVLPTLGMNNVMMTVVYIEYSIMIALLLKRRYIILF